MRVLTLATVLVLFASGVSAQSVPADLQKAIEARGQTLRTADADAWGRLTTDDFVVINPDGTVVTKKQRMEQIKASKPNPTPGKSSEQQTRVYGDAAVLTNLQEGNQGPTRFTTVWVKQNGQWKVASVQQTRVTKK
jgi:ketosteroid isomerase-like protein